MGDPCTERLTQPSLAKIYCQDFSQYTKGERGESLGSLKPVVIKARAIRGDKKENKTADISIWEGLRALCTKVKCLPSLECRSVLGLMDT